MVTVRASLSTSSLSVAPFSLLLLAVVWELIGTVLVTREMKGLLFILLVAALLFIGGYITVVSRYRKFFLIVLKLILILVMI